MSSNGNSNLRCINYYDLCRICTSTATIEQNINIYSPEGSAKNLQHKIAECLGLQIDEKDRLPKVVCGQCVQQVEQIYEYRNVCKNSQTMLSNCLNIRTVPSEDKIYIKDAISDSGKSLSVLGTSSQQQNAPSNDLISSIIQAVSMQPQQQYTITVDNSNQHHLQPQTIAIQPEIPVKTEKQNVLEEFIRLKPDIKITPLGKKDIKAQTMQAATVTQAAAPQPSQVAAPPSAAAPLQMATTQLNLNDPGLWQQLQQLQLQQQLQQLTSQLQGQNQFEDSGDNKKPKLNFVISTPAALPQAASVQPQFAAAPQIQLQLMPGGGVAAAPAPAAPVQPQFNASSLLSTLTGNHQTTAGNLLSPNKCFLPITIRDENSDQQIVAHIDTKNLVLPTTYQVQMKLQPQLATADGQPIMQLTPTSIPATLQLTPQTSVPIQSQFLTQALTQQQQQQPSPSPSPHTPPRQAQVTSQQIIRSPQSTMTTNPQLVIRNVVKSDQISASTPPSMGNEMGTFKTPSPRQRPQLPVKNSSSSAPAAASQAQPNRLVTQMKAQPLPTTSAAHQQRLNSITTITKVATKQLNHQATPTTSAPAKLPQLNKQNITISRISSTAPNQQHTLSKPQPKSTPSPTNPTPTPISLPTHPPITVSVAPQIQPTPIASQHKKCIKRPPLPTVETADKKSRPQQQILPGPTAEPLPTNEPLTGTSVSSLTCPTCMREFKKKEHLTQHVKLHDGIRPFRCTEEGCDKAFSRKEHLSRHLISHSGQKMFTCEVCKKFFSRKDNLNKHKRIHAQPPNETLYSCDICNKNFASKLHYEKHREMHKKPAAVSTNVNQVAANKDLYEVKVSNKSQQTTTNHAAAQQHQQQQQPQIMHVVTTQDLAGNTITITQAPPDSNSLANFVQLGFPQFQQAEQKIEK
ncbi:uncharacterized protein Dwil_GK13775 [Drosophila willistoni]|uniref:Uncharacterized protein n=2 Tax=Drosophila willistoni TaxID=7260 RepID=B4NIN6_DROWI|nr:transcription factor Sp2 isoform X1 [Drosophila willistoni]EDW83750.1 uncharacterized protein Dwil_GK13775 [Drosophila willistoni]